MSQKWCKIGPKLLLMTNRKLHTPFRLVPKSSTLDDLERPIRILFQNRCVFRTIAQKTRPSISLSTLQQKYYDNTAIINHIQTCWLRSIHIAHLNKQLLYCMMYLPNYSKFIYLKINSFINREGKFEQHTGTPNCALLSVDRLRIVCLRLRLQ